MTCKNNFIEVGDYIFNIREISCIHPGTENRTWIILKSGKEFLISNIYFEQIHQALFEAEICNNLTA